MKKTGEAVNGLFMLKLELLQTLGSMSATLSI